MPPLEWMSEWASPATLDTVSYIREKEAMNEDAANEGVRGIRPPETKTPGEDVRKTPEGCPEKDVRNSARLASYSRNTVFAGLRNGCQPGSAKKKDACQRRPDSGRTPYLYYIYYIA